MLSDMLRCKSEILENKCVINLLTEILRWDRRLERREVERMSVERRG